MIKYNNTSPLPKILCFVGNYLPGFKAGGTIRTIANMVSELNDTFEFLIVTRDRDLSDTVPYQNILINKWNNVGLAKVFYASPSTLSFIGVMRLMRDTQHDILYLNSFFSPFVTILPLIIRRIMLYGKKPVVIAPRGEFSSGALALKATKKKFYCFFAKFAGIYRNLIWQASSDFELEDIRRMMLKFMKAPNVLIAPDILQKSILSPELRESFFFRHRMTGPLRAVFLSRISPKKNLDFLLRALIKVNFPVELSLYGPIEDSKYWSLCMSLMRYLPSHIAVTYKGEVIYEHVAATFAAHDLFIFPTRGENFGHVIYESLVVGTAVIVSDQTPWKTDPQGAVEVLALENLDVWTAVINDRACFNNQAYAKQRIAVQHYMQTYLATSQALEQNRNLFFSALGNSPSHCSITV